MDIATWAPTYSLDVIGDGEVEILNQFTGRTKDRTKWYRPFDKADFGLTNSSGQANDKWRQDYSLLLSNPAGTGTAGETTSFNMSATSGGTSLVLHQQIRETVRTVAKDTGIQLRLRNTTGRFRLLAVIVEERKEGTRGTPVA